MAQNIPLRFLRVPVIGGDPLVVNFVIDPSSIQDLSDIATVEWNFNDAATSPDHTESRAIYTIAGPGISYYGLAHQATGSLGSPTRGDVW